MAKLFAGLGGGNKGGESGGGVGGMKGGIDNLKKAFQRTVLVKDLRIYKEREKQRRSDLLYGTTDMKTKLFERAQKEKKQRKKESANEG